MDKLELQISKNTTVKTTMASVNDVFLMVTEAGPIFDADLKTDVWLDVIATYSTSQKQTKILVCDALNESYIETLKNSSKLFPPIPGEAFSPKYITVRYQNELEQLKTATVNSLIRKATNQPTGCKSRFQHFFDSTVAH